MNEAKGGAGAYLLVMLIAGGAGFYFGQQSAGATATVAVDGDVRQLGVVVDPIPLVHRLFKFEPAHGDHQPQHKEDRKRDHDGQNHEQEVLHTSPFAF